MSLSLVTFWKRLLDSGLIDSTIPPLWAQAYAQDHASALPSDPLALANWLVSTNRLNRFCARQCCHEKWTTAPRLRVAGVVRAGIRVAEPFPNWIPIELEPSTSPSGSALREPGMMLAVLASSLQPSDGDLLRRHAAISHPRLAQVRLAPMSTGSLGSVEELGQSDVSVHPTIHLPSVGWCLPIAETFQPCSRTGLPDANDPALGRVVAMTLADLCEPISVLHAAGLTHNSIHAGTVWQDLSGSIVVIRNPLELLSPQVASSLGQSRKSPEDSSFTDDIAAIGRLGFWLRHGKTIPDTIQSLPTELADAVHAGSAGDPLDRVLAYAMSPDVSARFPSAETLGKALRAAANAFPDVSPAARAVAPPSQPPPLAPRQSPTVSNRSPVAGEPKPTPVPPVPVAKTPVPTAIKPLTAEAKPLAAAVVAAPTPAHPKPTVATSVQLTANAAQAHASVTDESAVPSAATPSGLPTPPVSVEPSEPVLATPAVPRRVRRRRNQNAVYVLSALCVPVLVLMIAVLVQDPTATRPEPTPLVPTPPAALPSIASTPSTANPSTRRPPISPTVAAPPAKAVEGFEVVDRNELLWAPPDALAPESENQATRPATALLPPGPAAVLVVDLPRLNQMNILAAWQPETDPWLEQLEKQSGVALDKIQRVAVAVFPGTDGVPKTSLAVTLVQPMPLSDLTAAWEASPGRAPSGATIFSSGETDAPAYFPLVHGDDSGKAASADDQVDAFALGSVERITEVAELGGSEIVFPRQFEELWSSGDDGDAIRFLTQPNFLAADARSWTAAASPELLRWIKLNLIPECGGLLIRIAPGIESSGYLEVRLAVAPGSNPSTLSGRINEQLQGAKQTAEEFLVTRQVDPSWRLLAGRLPAMWSFLARQSRSGRAEGQLIWNAYLPDQAIGQWSLATLLAANTAPSVTSVAAAPSGDQLTVAQMLDRPMSISFDQESLQFAVESIAKQFAEDLPPGNTMPPVNILGGDLQKNGITQNQQVRDFNKQSLPLRQVLTELVLGANPDRTATGPSDLKQSLIWVVEGEGSDAKILITTRDAAAGKYELPVEFQSKPQS